MSKNSKELALLDFDGTILRSDSLKIFCQYCSKSRTSFLLNYYIYCKVAGLISKIGVKHFTARHFLKVSRSNKIENFNDLLEKTLFPDILEIIKKLKYSKKTVVIVSASFEEIIGEFVRDRLQCILISNSIEQGNLDINFAQKLLSVKELFPDHKITVAYGNSPGDYAMLKAADLSYIRHKNGVLEIWKN